MKLQLYPWQEECLQIWSKHQHHGIINVVTGAGKTVMALCAIEELRRTLSIPLRVKIVVPQTFLTAQWSSVMQKLSGIPRQEIGYYYGAHKDSADRPYMIYVVNSARYALSRHILRDIKKGCAVFLIADECHHYASQENRKIFEFLPHLRDLKKNYYSLGLSATPRTDGYEQYLVPALGSEIYRYTFRDAAGQKNIRPFACFHISLCFSPEEEDVYEDLSDRLTVMARKLAARCPSLKKLKGVQFFHALKHLAHSVGTSGVSHSFGTSGAPAVSGTPVISGSTSAPDNSGAPGIIGTARMAQIILSLLYQRSSVVYNAAARIHCALHLVEKLDPASRILIFGERIEQADQLYRRLAQQYPGQVGRYHSRMEPEARKTAISRYRDGEIRILVTCRALDEGFDIPSANVGIVLSSSSVERQRIQRLGRILRNFGENSTAGLYYLYVQSSTERPTYMEETQQNETGTGKTASFSLSYNDKTGQFVHPAYEDLALLTLEKLKSQGKTQRTLDECRRCLSLGLLRTDWLMDADEITAKIERAQSTREENYWVCMKMMALSINFCPLSQ